MTAKTGGRLITQFEEEHQEALEEIEKLFGATREVQERGLNPQSRKVIWDFCTFLRESLNTHFSLEESYLFPELDNKLGAQGGPVAVMFHEHSMLRRTHGDLVRVLKTEAPDSNQVVDLAARIYEVLKAHIHKEDTVLFPMARQVLSEQDLRDMDIRSGVE